MLHHFLEIHAHRGARSFFPENTIPAFLKAVELGVEAIELDLCVSGDNQVVVSHDPYMQAGLCTAPNGRVLTKSDEKRYLLYTMKYADIVRFDCGRPSAEFPGQQEISAVKPLLADVFRLVERHGKELCEERGMIYNLEVKSRIDGDSVRHPAPGEYAELVAAVIEQSGVASRTRVQSFDARIIEEIRKFLPSLALGLLVGMGQDPETELDKLGFKPDYLNPFFPMVDATLVKKLHDRDIGIVPWTVNSPEEMKALAAMGVDGIITDCPERAVEVLHE
ncbi:glycerophosphodiester phosphodiesterase family protein [Prosthecochloris sp. SCSIO W1103]|uniref:glycerophosphodiester phosphodiesterase family protein n=1 Tax=Prosthecochloris sp. SCSIO W1103 TaxID=2992244 RepID=UPI00223DB9C6|nr:glycerophosphodiester phosphodiesterase family protein [Prosthecochloris sp. SCSIO W1103]UZJ37837.1 glycerophosphodiester phosphodiesterase family protein [Prosthecochloris sp. SCSIO W1103]